MTCAGQIAEIFQSIQGEGLLVGTLQLFIRLAGCTIGCPWCDTVAHMQQANSFPDGRGNRVDNPISATSLVQLIKAMPCQGKPWTVITGGEPLEQTPFLVDLLPKLIQGGNRIHLETAGIHHQEIKQLLPWIHHISMDWKLPSSGGHDWRKEHCQFMAMIPNQGSGTAVKIVIDADSPFAEVEEATRETASHLPQAELFLQPASGKNGPTKETITQTVNYLQALQPIPIKTRMLPQIHKLLDLP